MAKRYTLVVPAGGAMDIQRSAMTTTTGTIATPTANQIIILIGNTVSTSRKTEIINTWRWLLRGVKEGNLLDKSTYNASALVTAVSLDNRNITNRRTAATAAGVTFAEANDVAISWGSAIAPTGDVIPLLAAIEKLIQYARETAFKSF